MDYTYEELHSVKVEQSSSDTGSILFKNEHVGELSVAVGFFDIPDVEAVAALIKQQVVNWRLSRANSL